MVIFYIWIGLFAHYVEYISNTIKERVRVDVCCSVCNKSINKKDNVYLDDINIITHQGCYDIKDEMRENYVDWFLSFNQECTSSLLYK